MKTKLSYRITETDEIDNIYYVSIYAEKRIQTFKININNNIEFFMEDNKVFEYVSFNIYIYEYKKTFLWKHKEKVEVKYLVSNNIEIKNKEFVFEGLLPKDKLYKTSEESIQKFLNSIFEGLLPKNKIYKTPQESIQNLLNNQETQKFLNSIKNKKRI